MTFDQMRYFIHLARVGSYTVAAQELYISQPNLTKYIAGMEKEFGFRLFDRSTHHVKLTTQGELLLKKVEPLFLSMSFAIEEVKLSHRFNRNTTPLAVGVSHDEVIPAALMDFFYEHNSNDPRFYYTLTHDSYLRLISGLRKRTYDMVITTDRNIRNQPDFDFIKLRKFEIMLAVRKDHPLAQKPGLRPTDFDAEPVFFFLPDGRDISEDILENIYYQIGGTVNLQVTNSLNDLLLNVQIGAGVAMTPSLVQWKSFPDIVMRSFVSRGQGAYQVIAWHVDNNNTGVMEVVNFLRSNAIE